MFKAATPIQTGLAPRVEKNVLGIFYMMLGMFLFAGADTIAKVLTADFHPVQIAWTRMMGLVIAVIFLLATNGLQVLKTNSPFLQICRGAVAVCSATLFIVAVTYVPLADAIAVSFVAPFMVTLLGAWVLKERVGRRRWIAICIGFLATLIILRPGTGTVHPAAALILVAALFFALRQIISRVLGGTDKTATTITYTALVAGILLSLPLPFFWETPTQSRELLLFLGLAVLAGTGELLVIKSLEVAQAVVLAPVHYSLIVWGTFYGWMVFHQLPDLWTFVGALIIVATGIYTIRREMQVKRQALDQT